MNTDLTQLFKTITESVPHYLMFMGLVFLAYSLTIATIKVISDNVVTVVLAARAPVTFKIKDGGELENT
jgi:hypothetical protein